MAKARSAKDGATPTQEIDSDGSASGKTPGKSPFTGMTPAEAIAKNRERRSARFTRLLEQVPERTKKIVSNIPSSYLDRYLRARLGEASPRLAIRAKCEECCGYEEVKLRVGDCTSYSCPIWMYRPYQTKANASAASAVGP